jgi:NADPH:quinone reductase-like Zn-dependent oxidoreductase
VIDEVVGEPGPGEVLLEVRAVGTNPIDYKLYGGQIVSDPSVLPMHLGSEAAGVITAVGPDATGPAGPISLGDQVIAYRIGGAYASQVIIPAASVVPKPSSMSFEEASGLMLTGCTAIHALTVTGVKGGDTVVIHGAAGGVGLMAVQLAVAAGATVIGTASAARHDALRALGAVPVLYGDGLLARIEALATDGVDAAIDMVGTVEAVDTSVALVHDRSRIASIVRSPRAIELGIALLGMGPGADPGNEIRDAARLELVEHVKAGTLSVLVAATYPLEDAAEANRELAAGHTHGKIVLIP